MPPTSHNALRRSVLLLLRPVLAFCLRHSLRLREILELVKVCLVDIAIDELKERGEPVSASKVALMTGVHRKDAVLLISSTTPREMNSGLFLRVIGQWKSDKRFQSKDGRPRPLKHVGKQSEFAKLVRAVNKELNPYSVLFELERTGAVSVRDDVISLVGNEYVPYGKIEDIFSLVGNDVEDLVRAAEENVIHPAVTPNLHLTTAYDNIVLEAVPEIRRWFMAEGAALHERARAFLSRFDKDINPDLKDKPAGARASIGSFSITESAEEQPVKEPRRTGRKAV